MVVFSRLFVIDHLRLYVVRNNNLVFLVFFYEFIEVERLHHTVVWIFSVFLIAVSTLEYSGYVRLFCIVVVDEFAIIAFLTLIAVAKMALKTLKVSIGFLADIAMH